MGQGKARQLKYLLLKTHFGENSKKDLKEVTLFGLVNYLTVGLNIFILDL